MIKVAINGFGRIGRNVFKVALEEHAQDLEIVAINDLTEPAVLAHLLKYDTAYGHWGDEISAAEHAITVNGRQYPIYTEKEPAKLPWGQLGVDVVIESTGRFTDEEGMKQHLLAGALQISVVVYPN